MHSLNMVNSYYLYRICLEKNEDLHHAINVEAAIERLAIENVMKKRNKMAGETLEFAELSQEARNTLACVVEEEKCNLQAAYKYLLRNKKLCLSFDENLFNIYLFINKNFCLLNALTQRKKARDIKHSACGLLELTAIVTENLDKVLFKTKIGKSVDFDFESLKGDLKILLEEVKISRNFEMLLLDKLLELAERLKHIKAQHLELRAMGYDIREIVNAQKVNPFPAKFPLEVIALVQSYLPKNFNLSVSKDYMQSGRFIKNVQK